MTMIMAEPAERTDIQGRPQPVEGIAGAAGAPRRFAGL